MVRMSHRTDLDIQAKGWAKVGKKHYENVDGIVIKYNHNAFRWVLYGKDGKAEYNFSTLWAAMWWAEKDMV